MRDLTVPASELQKGDRIEVGRSLTRTVAYLTDTGYKNRRNVPILAVYYAEGDTPEWGRGNAWAATSPVTVTR
jgi:hypothetical protein